MPISRSKPPSADHVASVLSDINWEYLDSGDDGGVFDYELSSIKASSDEAYEVTLRVYSAWADITETGVDQIEVFPWDFYLEVYFEPTAEQWRVIGEGINDPVEQPPQLIVDMPDSQAKIETLIQRAFDGWTESDLEDLDIDELPITIRPYLESYIRRRGGE